MIGGTHSGSGKTTVTLGIMAALSRRGLNIQPFKCGPDFIDPTLHQLVTGRVSRNLDIRMCGEEYVRRLFGRFAPDKGVSVVEGVMGLFDGGDGSGARLSKLLGLPVLLVVDVRSSAESVAAVVRGFETLDPAVQVYGVVLNRVASERHASMTADAVRKYCRARVIGSLPFCEEFAIPSRHLGLHTGDETPIDRKRQEMLADTIEKHLDLKSLLEMAAKCRFQDTGDNARRIRTAQPSRTVRIGVARDKAFCFYYEDNLELLRDYGAETVFFSPLHDRALPENLHGIYLGGGYPELYAPQLSENTPMREEILRLSSEGLPLYAECGGFMYLTLGIENRQKSIYPMAGVFPVISRMQKRLTRLGYRKIKLTGPSLLGDSGLSLYGHEFHYSEIEPMPPEVRRVYRVDDERTEGYAIDNTLAGYIHLHWGRTPEAAERFVHACGRGKYVNS